MSLAAFIDLGPTGLSHFTSPSDASRESIRWQARTTEEWFLPMNRPISGKLIWVWRRARNMAAIRATETVRVRRDELLTLQVDGEKGSAVAGLRKCCYQSAEDTPKFVWNPDVDSPIDPYANWSEIPSHGSYDNAFKAQWELFLRHVATDEPFPWSLLEAARGVQLAEKAIESWQKRSWIDIPELA